MVARSHIVVRYAETDQMGIAHHSNYSIWYEAVSAAYYEDHLIVQAELKKVTGAKLEIEYVIYRENDETPINVGKTIHALVGRNLKPVNVKKEYPELYQKLISAVEKPLLEDKEK